MKALETAPEHANAHVARMYYVLDLPQWSRLGCIFRQMRCATHSILVCTLSYDRYCVDLEYNWRSHLSVKPSACQLKLPAVLKVLGGFLLSCSLPFTARFSSSWRDQNAPCWIQYRSWDPLAIVADGDISLAICPVYQAIRCLWARPYPEHHQLLGWGWIRSTLPSNSR